MPFCSFSDGAAMFDVTPIENMFLLEYLPGAPGDALRVYLYARMLCLHPELGEGIGDMARALSMEEDDVQEAFAYWERLGLVEKISDREPSYSIRPLYSESFHAQKVKVASHYLELRNRVNQLLEKNGIVHEKQFRLFLDWIEDMHYDEDAALRILEYAKDQRGGKTPPSVFNRAHKIAIEWFDRGARTLQDVEAAIRYDGKIYKMASLVTNQLSLFRAPTLTELECVRRWIEEYKASEQDVLEACAETIKSRSPSFAYLDSILQKRSRKDEEASFEQVKNLIHELGIVGMNPTSEHIRQYRQWLQQGFDGETVLLAAAQCVQKGKNTFEKLDWMLKEWGEAGVFTQNRALAYLAENQKMKSEAGEVLRRAGLTGEPGKTVLNFYENWKKRHSVEIIACAADYARGKEKALNYMEKLLKDWTANGITTVEAAQARHEHMAAEAKTAAQPNTRMNYQQHSYTEEDFGKDFFYDPAKDYAQEGDAK